MLKSLKYSESQMINNNVSYKKIVGSVERIDSDISEPLVAVYCGSKMGAKPIYAESAYALGQELAKSNMGLVYGGASIGLMGKVADGTLSENGSVVGVIPEFILDFEVGHSGLTEFYVVDTMHERKAMMADRASAFITLPGGLGTLEEIMEVATWGQLDRHVKPMIILNIDGFYNRLLEHLAHAVAEGFMKPEDRTRLIVCNSVEEAVDMLTGVVR